MIDNLIQSRGQAHALDFRKEMTMNLLKYPERVLAEVNLVSSHFGPVDFAPDEYDSRTLIVESFNLPPGFNKAASKLLITLPSDYPEKPVEAMYLEKDLKKNGCRPGHYFEHEYGDVNIREAGYAWYSIHFKSWKANIRSIIRGDNLLSAIDALYHALKSDH